MLESRGLSVGYDPRRSILSGIDLSLPEGEICALIGANGCGKSTLLRALAGVQRITAGDVLVSGRSITTLPRRDIARQIALMTQSPTGPEGLTVTQLVSHGLFARHGLLSRPDRAGDARIVAQALDQTGLTSFAHRPFDALSGGERQRVWIALALAQQPRMLLLDEPTSYLDMGHQQDVLHLLCDLRDQRGLGIVMVLHDINHASGFADRIIALQGGGILVQGTPADTVSPDLVYKLFGARVAVLPGTGGTRPYCIPEAGRVDPPAT